MPSSSTQQPNWVSFFTDAGIPSKFAAKYAVIFSEHRIQKDMLKDLNKEILYDMGIKTMGDVIAIMRYAKEVQEEENRKKILSSSSIPSPTVVSSGSSSSSSATTSSGIKMQNTRRPDVPQRQADVERIERNERPVLSKSAKSGISSNLAKRLGPQASVEKRSIEIISMADGKRIRMNVGDASADSASSGSRVVRIPTLKSDSEMLSINTNSGVFSRLGKGDSHKISSKSAAGVFDRLTTSTQVPMAAVKPTTVVRMNVRNDNGSSIKDRLGVQMSMNSDREIVSSNIRIKSDPSSGRQVSTGYNKPKIVSLKKSIFDRLGS